MQIATDVGEHNSAANFDGSSDYNAAPHDDASATFNIIVPPIKSSYNTFYVFLFFEFKSTSGDDKHIELVIFIINSYRNPDHHPNLHTPAKHDTTLAPTISRNVAPTTAANDQSNSSGFFSNTGAVAGVFTVVGVVVLAVVFALITNAVRKRRARKFDREIADAAAEAAAAQAPAFLDDDDDDIERRAAGYGRGGTSGGYGASGSKESYTGYDSGYGQPNLGYETYGMSEIPSNASATGLVAGAGAAGIGASALARARSQRALEAQGLAPGAGEAQTPYPAFVAPGAMQAQDQWYHNRPPQQSQQYQPYPQPQYPSPPPSQQYPSYTQSPPGSQHNHSQSPSPPPPAALQPGYAGNPGSNEYALLEAAGFGAGAAGGATVTRGPSQYTNAPTSASASVYSSDLSRGRSLGSANTGDLFYSGKGYPQQPMPSSGPTPTTASTGLGSGGGSPQESYAAHYQTGGGLVPPGAAPVGSDGQYATRTVSPLPNPFSPGLGSGSREDDGYGGMAESEDEDDQDDGGRRVLKVRNE
ncbi:hypothetical protein CCMSSC00406_0009915 [Pleurotus cornucopiae]|uniref:Uncharacterized protein n=1 Tax=Pleurotus cornucopiae TaxID=5321 RepID=A0ACB7IUT9_PLECO|nr:hypothetical protein CCMSSC00406_0009915 [Pleurotus cornucopiae]